eukprot:13692524-Alexandrium_andersonii.AAC.1
MEIEELPPLRVRQECEALLRSGHARDVARHVAGLPPLLKPLTDAGVGLGLHGEKCAGLGAKSEERRR